MDASPIFCATKFSAKHRSNKSFLAAQRRFIFRNPPLGSSAAFINKDIHPGRRRLFLQCYITNLISCAIKPESPDDDGGDDDDENPHGVMTPSIFCAAPMASQSSLWLCPCARIHAQGYFRARAEISFLPARLILMTSVCAPPGSCSS